MYLEDSPFHDGEQWLQLRYGVLEHVHSYATRGIRTFMPDQHRKFYGTLPYVFIGIAGKEGQIFATVLWGTEGFIGSPDAETLTIQATFEPADPIWDYLKEGAEIGLLGLQFWSRRRNRLNGRITDVSENGFSIKVSQSFGNCPKYIQKRILIGRKTYQKKHLSYTDTRAALSHEDRMSIEKMDTFFIASASSNLGIDEKHGTDMSHRGGKAGFVKILSDGTLLVPDFSGNKHFNTFGNIVQNPHVAILFIDFQSGSLLHISGTAKILSDGETAWQYEGAERYLHITPVSVIARNNRLPFLWSKSEESPFLPGDDGWQRTVDAGVQERV